MTIARGVGVRRAVRGSDGGAAVRGRRRAARRHRDAQGRRPDHRRRVRRLERHLFLQRRRARGSPSRRSTLTAFPGLPPLPARSISPPTGSGTFEEPRYDVKWSVQDLFFGDEGIGEVTGRLSVRGLLMTYELEAASPRLAVSGTGRIELNDEMDAELSFRVTDTSLDPYVRAFQPTLSPYTTAIASGTIRVVGELYNPDALRIDTSDRTGRSAAARLPPAQSSADAARASSARCCRSTRASWSATTPSSISAGSVESARSGAVAAGQRRREPGRAAGIMPDMRSSGRAEVVRAHRRHRDASRSCPATRC